MERSGTRTLPLHCLHVAYKLSTIKLMSLFFICLLVCLFVFSDCFFVLYLFLFVVCSFVVYLFLFVACLLVYLGCLSVVCLLLLFVRLFGLCFVYFVNCLPVYCFLLSAWLFIFYCLLNELILLLLFWVVWLFVTGLSVYLFGCLFSYFVY